MLRSVALSGSVATDKGDTMTLEEIKSMRDTLDRMGEAAFDQLNHEQAVACNLGSAAMATTLNMLGLNHLQRTVIAVAMVVSSIDPAIRKLESKAATMKQEGAHDEHAGP